jgi:P4 family phage/plasmid primase-like protien
MVAHPNSPRKAGSNGTARNTTHQAAVLYRQAEISVIPIRRGGSKAPDAALLPTRLDDDGNEEHTWDPFKDRLPSVEEIKDWYDRAHPPGIATVGGKVSGNLEQIDFDIYADTIFPEWCALVEAECPGLIARLNVVQTPREPAGFHFRYRCRSTPIPGNTKLAEEPYTDPDTGKPKKRTLIETGGEGGYALAPGSPPECHENRRPYVHFSGPVVFQVQDITPEEREVLWRCARSFDRDPPEEQQEPKKGGVKQGLRPGDDYNARGPDWSNILAPHGWQCLRASGAKSYWRRPDKDGPGWSATTGYCTGKNGEDLLAVFSSNAHPFPGPSNGKNCSVHSKFAAHCLLNHGRDWKAAAKDLAAQGYGDGRRHEADGRQPDSQALDGKPAEENKEHLTDLGNAKRVVRRHGENLRYCYPWKRALTWDGKRWAEDDTGESIRMVKETQADFFAWVIRELAVPDEDDDGDEDARERRKARKKRLQAMLAHALKWEEAHEIAACLELVKSEPGIPVRPADLDTNPWLFNVPNGTIDLRTGKLLPHQRGHLITKLAAAHYDPDAKCPLWERVLDRIMGGSGGLIRYLQRTAGYSLAGDVSEQVLFFLHGAGQNGKSLYLGVVKDVWGDYGCQAVSELLMAKNTEAHPTERADLFGRRFVATIETDEGKRMAEALMKQLTGGDAVKARKMRQDFFEMRPTWKIFLAANHKLMIRGGDFAVWRRIKMIPFAVTITEAEKDPHLGEKLKPEWPGILAWAARGCLDWQREGLGEPDEVRKATEAYRAELDLVQGFIDECCFVNGNARAKASALHEA